MTTRPDAYPHKKHLVIAMILNLIGALSAGGWMLCPHPFALLIFLLFGQVLIIASLIIISYVMVRDLKAHNGEVS